MKINNLKQHILQGKKFEHFFSLDSISKSYGDTSVLKNFSLNIEPGKMYGLVGASGTGKTTALQIAGLLDDATTGKIIFCDMNCGNLGDSDKSKMRNTYFGFIYQFHHLLSDFTVLENILMPSLIAKNKYSYDYKYANELLHMLDILPEKNKLPSQISGGQRQRAAIARALINKPKIIFADEPTGNLDEDNATKVFDILQNYIKSNNAAVLIATHHGSIVEKLDHIIQL
jgi:lipoprotein-releasing system ATP-binding protein